MNKELRTKTSEELCSLIMRLKLSLLETRFKMASGEGDKNNQAAEIRKTIARALTILNQREIDVTIGTHGVTMYDRKNNKVKSITNVVAEALKAKETTKSGKESKTETVKDAITKATIAASGKPVEEKDTPAKPAAAPAIKKELKSQMDRKAKKEVIRKTVGGGA
jgi:large subunit ribosomal protein L29